ncbi:hypothetical protein J6590_025179 [Homalodisca vitripennis]|nr:hypothetical protein J6590_025179 [Homalodisca vitripennis]
MEYNDASKHANVAIVTIAFLLSVENHQLKAEITPVIITAVTFSFSRRDRKTGDYLYISLLIYTNASHRVGGEADGNLREDDGDNRPRLCEALDKTSFQLEHVILGLEWISLNCL